MFTFETGSGTYRCDISDVVNSTSQKDAISFTRIWIFPQELSKEYAPVKLSGIYIVYRMEDVSPNVLTETSSLEMLMKFTEEGSPDDVYEMFSLTAKRCSKKLQEQASELMEFLHGQVSSWDAYTWTKNIETIDRAEATTQEMFFYLHTNDGLYRCDIRQVLESTDQTDIGISSVSIFPALYPGERPPFEDEVYRETCAWGRENMRISIVYRQGN